MLPNNARGATPQHPKSNVASLTPRALSEAAYFRALSVVVEGRAAHVEIDPLSAPDMTRTILFFTRCAPDVREIIFTEGGDPQLVYLAHEGPIWQCICLRGGRTNFAPVDLTDSFAFVESERVRLAGGAL